MQMVRKVLLCKSVFLKHLHGRLILRADLDGKISRRELLRFLGIVYHIPHEKKGAVVNELKSCGLILSSDKVSFTINSKF